RRSTDLYFKQVCVAFGADFQVASGERDFATELIVVELRLSWWRKECAVNLFISQASPVQHIVGQIHQALRAAEIDFPGLQAGYRLEVLVVEITRFFVFMGRKIGRAHV